MYVRQVDGKTLNLGHAGALWRDSLVIFDRETDTYWSQVSGEAIKGEMVGKGLENLPARVMTWTAWRRLHPDTLVLVKEREATESPYEEYASSPVKMGILGSENPDDRLAGKQVVLGVAIDGEAAAFAHDDLSRTGIAAASVAGKPVVVAYDRAGRSAAAFSREAAGRELTFRAEAADPRTVRDDQTGSAWDLIRGVATAGPLEGTELEELPAVSAYWFAWVAFHPRTSVWEPPGTPGE